MGTTTTTFALNKPTVGGDDNAWGTDWNTNADKLDDLLDGTTAIKPNLSEGLWKVGGVAVTPSAAELNILDGATLTVTELNYVDGVTSAIQTQLDGKQASDGTLTSLSGLSLAAGDVLYATAADTLARLPVGSAGQILTVNPGATAPQWSASPAPADGSVTEAKLASSAVARAKLKTGTNSGSYSTGSGGGSGTIVLDAYSFFPSHSGNGNVGFAQSGTVDAPRIAWSTSATGSGTVSWRYVLA